MSTKYQYAEMLGFEEVIIATQQIDVVTWKHHYLPPHLYSSTLYTFKPSFAYYSRFLFNFDYQMIEMK